MIYTDGEYLISDKDEKELHIFASMIGLNKRKDFHNKKMLYYDLNGKDHKAKRHGAKKVTTRSLLRLIKGKGYGSLK